jgi:hypothetical protein
MNPLVFHQYFNNERTGVNGVVTNPGNELKKICVIVTVQSSLQQVPKNQTPCPFGLPPVGRVLQKI